jgi:hypothetical protein
MKKRNRYKKWGLVLWAISLSCGAGAQGVFGWRAPLDTIRKDGFYQILLTPRIVVKCSKADLADVRIQGPDNRFVSYVLKDSPGRFDTIAKWLSLPAAAVAQKDSSNKHSYIDVRFSDSFEIDRLGFVIREPVFYKRDARVLVEGVNPAEWTLLTATTLAPGATRLSIPAVKTGRLRIDIANADNAPLVVDSVTGFQLSRWLIAYLKAGQVYQVLAGDAQARAPEYDLKSFTDSLTAMPPTLVPGPLQNATVANVQPAAPVVRPAGGGHSGSLLLWGILLAVLILLVFFSVRMVRAITQKERHDRV